MKLNPVADSTSLSRSGQWLPSRPAAAPGEIRVFSRCRNEALRLPAFLEHRRLGVDGFFIIDNDSTDGTTDYLAGQPDVRAFRTAAQ